MNRSVTAEKPWPKYPPTFERSIVTSLFRGFCLHYYSSRLSLYFLPSYTTWHFVFRCEDHSHNIGVDKPKNEFCVSFWHQFCLLVCLLTSCDSRWKCTKTLVSFSFSVAIPKSSLPTWLTSNTAARSEGGERVQEVGGESSKGFSSPTEQSCGIWSMLRDARAVS